MNFIITEFKTRYERTETLSVLCRAARPVKQSMQAQRSFDEIVDAMTSIVVSPHTLCNFDAVVGPESNKQQDILDGESFTKPMLFTVA